jgi:hypothetical protein
MVVMGMWCVFPEHFIKDLQTVAPCKALRNGLPNVHKNDIMITVSNALWWHNIN